MTFEKVKEVIVETISCSEDKVTLEAKLKDDLGIDSLDAMELCMALEEEYSLSMEEDAIANFITVGNIVTYLDSKVA